MTTAQLMKRHTANASADSATLYLSADRSGRSPILNFLESTRAECRNRLWGITTAPSSEMAMKSARPSGMTGRTMPAITPPPSPPSSMPI